MHGNLLLTATKNNEIEGSWALSISTNINQ